MCFEASLGVPVGQSARTECVVEGIVDGSGLLDCARRSPIIYGKAVSCNSLLDACALSSLAEDVFHSANRSYGEILGSEYVVDEGCWQDLGVGLCPEVANYAWDGSL